MSKFYVDFCLPVWLRYNVIFVEDIFSFVQGLSSHYFFKQEFCLQLVSLHLMHCGIRPMSGVSLYH